MSIYCRIEAGRVVEIGDFVVDPRTLFHEGLVWVSGDADVRYGWHYDGSTFSAPVPPAPTQSDLLAASAAARWARETGGITVGEMAVPTDERTQQVLMAAYVMASADPDYTIPTWKTGPGAFVALDADAILAIAQAVQAHVQACFALNRTTDEAILAGTITSIAEVQAAYA